MVWLYQGINTELVATSDPKPLPSVTIVVSLKNESKNVVSLIHGLKEIDYPLEKLELILVDDNSTDDTYNILQRYSNEKVYVVKNKGVGKKQAIETGISLSKSKWIAVTDADCNVPKTWISSMVESITDQVQMILGPVFIQEKDGFINSLQVIEFLGLQGTTAGSAGKGKPVSANAANMLFRKEAFLKVNPYVNNYALKTGDDQFLLMAILEEFPTGIVYSLKTESIVITNPVKTWKKYFKQRIRWASKGKSYSNWFIKAVGLLVFGTSFLIVTSVFSGVILRNWTPFYILLTGKLLADLLVIIPMKSFSNSKFNLFEYIGSGLLYPFVVVYTLIRGLFT